MMYASLRQVNISICIYSDICVCVCVLLIFTSLILCVFFTAVEPSDQKIGGLSGPMFPEYGTVEARIKTFQQSSVSVETLAEAGFFNSGRYFTIYCVLNMIPEQQFF